MTCATKGDYHDFLASKRQSVDAVGFEVSISEINDRLFDWQRAIVRWAVARGRSALFLDTGTGKTAIQLEWAHQTLKMQGRRALILAPLAVARQTAREADKFGIGTPVTVCRYGSDVRDGINVTNYERLHHFDASEFDALVLDESSIIKSFDGKVRAQIMEFASAIRYRLACTATPAPNDLIEITNHAEFLDIMSGKEIIALYFKQDGNTTHKWRLKGHAEKAFWEWMAQWCVALRRPSDIGYDNGLFVLPELRRHSVVLAGDVADGQLFAIEARTMQERRAARRASMDARVAECARLVADAPDTDSWLIWCDLNAESEALVKAIPGAVEIRGSHSPEYKEDTLMAFVDGDVRVLVTKPSIAGFGLNFQHCHRMAFVGLSDSFESLYQATRRCWRFGQKEPVDVYVVTSENEGAVVSNIERKERQASKMFDEIVAAMDIHDLNKQARRVEMEYERDVATGDGWELHLGDSCEVLRDVEADSVGLSVFSPPFPGMYAYTNSPRDMGNVDGIDEMMDHFGTMIPDLLRVTMPGRMCCIHLMQLTAMKSRDGYIGVKDYRGRVISSMESEGWRYAGEVTIDKNPQIQATRNKERGLLFKSLATDSSMMRMALADYLIYFRKDGDNAFPIKAGCSEKYNPGGGWISEHQWIEWAHPVWYRHVNQQNQKMSGYPGANMESEGIRETDVLNVRQARDEKDERHLCPLQLGVIERAVMLWSAPGDVVLDPFTGIGSTGYTALRLGRRALGIELKPSYWRVARENFERGIADREQRQSSLFDAVAQ